MILVVDDHTDTCDALQMLLQRRGYQVQCVHSGYGAIAWMRQRKPDLVILDSMLPGMTGMEVLRAMRADGYLSDVPVVFYSADTDPLHFMDAVRLGVHGIIAKPGWEQLLSEVQSHVRA